jgi:hypothetical protein
LPELPKFTGREEEGKRKEGREEERKERKRWASIFLSFFLIF